MESYRAILDSANSISVGNSPAPGRSAPGQSEEMDILPETMHSMQKNAVYGMEVLDAALKHVRGESPTVVPVSIPPPPTGAPTAARMVGQGPPNSVNTTTSSSSLAGAVTSPQEAPAPVPPSSLPKANTAIKGNKDVGAIRVIEDGPLKKTESKEGVKSGDRKRQVRALLVVYFVFGCSIDILSQKTAEDGQHDGQTCLGCGATSTPEWRRGPLGAYKFYHFGFFLT